MKYIIKFFFKPADYDLILRRLRRNANTSKMGDLHFGLKPFRKCKFQGKGGCRTVICLYMNHLTDSESLSFRSRILVEGKLDYGEYVDKNQVRRQATTIIAGQRTNTRAPLYVTMKVV